MKLAIVRQRYVPSGNAERFVARTLPALERAGAVATLIAREAQGWGARRLLRVDPFHLGQRWAERSFAHAARQAWLREGFDLVQSHEPIPGCHVFRPDGGRLPQWKDTVEHPRLRAVLCPSNRIRDELRRSFRVAPEKLHVVYSGVDLAYFHPKERSRLRGAARAGIGCRPRDSVFLLAGSQGLAAAIEATRHESFWLVVAGEAPRGGVPERVRFVGRKDDLRPLYAAADALLDLSSDTFPDSVPEALAMGLPAVVSARSGAAELIEPRVNGWLWQPEDTAALASLLADADAAARSGQLDATARASAEKLGADTTARQVSELYASL